MFAATKCAGAAPVGFVETRVELEAPPVALAFAPDGTLFAAELAPGSSTATVRSFDVSGSPGPTFTLSGGAGFSIGGMTYDGTNERLLITTQSVGGGELRAIDAMGGQHALATGIEFIADVAVRGTGQILVSKADEAGSVLEIDPASGIATPVVTSLGYAAGIEFDDDGDLVVQDVNATTFLGRLQRVSVSELPEGELGFGAADELISGIQSGYGFVMANEDRFFASGGGGIYQLAGAPLVESSFYPSGFSTAIAFDPGTMPFEPWSGPGGGRLAFTRDFGDAFVTVISPARAGDYNMDGAIDSMDFARWRAEFGMSGALAADGNGDGMVDASDYVIWRRASVASASARAVPEPACAMLLVSLSGILLAPRSGREGSRPN